MTDDNTQEYLTELRKLLAARFNTGELRTLCFDMDVELPFILYNYPIRRNMLYKR
jgi:hypothetical protein